MRGEGGKAAVTSARMTALSRWSWVKTAADHSPGHQAERGEAVSWRKAACNFFPLNQALQRMRPWCEARGWSECSKVQQGHA